MESLLTNIYGAFDPPLVFGCFVIAVAVSRFHSVLVGSLLWSMVIEVIDFFTPGNEPPLLFGSWLFNTCAEVGVGLVAASVVWMAKRSIIAIFQSWRGSQSA